MNIKIRRLINITFILLISAGCVFLVLRKNNKYGAPPYIEEPEMEKNQSRIDEDDYSNWKRPEGPIRIGLQAGHWKTSEMPEEQRRIMENGGGTTGQGIPEWQIALNIAEETKKILVEKGYVVDIIPATVPENYLADAFVSIHADGNLSPSVRGYKVAAYQRDRTGNAEKLADLIGDAYVKTTGFSEDSNVSKNMTRYYAFNYRRYKHAIHPMTPGVIIETGFATNYYDASVLIKSPQKPAQGIANGIFEYINQLELN